MWLLAGLADGSGDKVFETRQTELLARALVTLAESHVGIAGFSCAGDLGEQAREMRVAEAYVQQGREGMIFLFHFPGTLSSL